MCFVLVLPCLATAASSIAWPANSSCAGEVAAMLQTQKQTSMTGGDSPCSTAYTRLSSPADAGSPYIVLPFRDGINFGRGSHIQIRQQTEFRTVTRTVSPPVSLLAAPSQVTVGAGWCNAAAWSADGKSGGPQPCTWGNYGSLLLVGGFRPNALQEPVPASWTEWTGEVWLTIGGAGVGDTQTDVCLNVTYQLGVVAKIKATGIAFDMEGCLQDSATMRENIKAFVTTAKAKSAGEDLKYMYVPQGGDGPIGGIPAYVGFGEVFNYIAPMQYDSSSDCYSSGGQYTADAQTLGKYIDAWVQQGWKEEMTMLTYLSVGAFKTTTVIPFLAGKVKSEGFAGLIGWPSLVGSPAGKDEPNQATVTLELTGSNTIEVGLDFHLSSSHQTGTMVSLADYSECAPTYNKGNQCTGSCYTGSACGADGISTCCQMSNTVCNSPQPTTAGSCSSSAADQDTFVCPSGISGFNGLCTCASPSEIYCGATPTPEPSPTPGPVPTPSPSPSPTPSNYAWKESPEGMTNNGGTYNLDAAGQQLCAGTWGNACCCSRGYLVQGSDSVACNFQTVPSWTVEGVENAEVEVTIFSYGHIFPSDVAEENPDIDCSAVKNGPSTCACGLCYAIYNPANKKYGIILGIDTAANYNEMGKDQYLEMIADGGGTDGTRFPFMWKPIPCPGQPPYTQG